MKLYDAPALNTGAQEGEAFADTLVTRGRAEPSAPLPPPPPQAASTAISDAHKPNFATPLLQIVFNLFALFCLGLLSAPAITSGADDKR